MRIDAPFVVHRSVELRPGDIAMISDGKRSVYALIIGFQSGSTSMLHLEGERIGQLDGDSGGGEKAITLKVKPTLRVPFQSEAWTSDGPPSVPLSLATDGNAYYFIHGVGSRIFAVNIETGLVTNLPHRALYTSQWSIDYINIDGRQVQLIQSQAG